MILLPHRWQHLLLPWKIPVNKVIRLMSDFSPNPRASVRLFSRIALVRKWKTTPARRRSTAGSEPLEAGDSVLYTKQSRINSSWHNWTWTLLFNIWLTHTCTRMCTHTHTPIAIKTRWWHYCNGRWLDATIMWDESLISRKWKTQIHWCAS